MRSLAILLVAAVGVQSAVINNPEDDVRRTAACVQDSGVSLDSMKKINSGQFDNDPKLKEYLWCVSRNAGFLNNAGDLQSEVIRVRLKGGHYSEDTINEVVQQCNQQKETPQETAFQFMKCVYGNTFQKRYT